MTHYIKNAEIIVLSDVETAQRTDLAEKAADGNASITEIHSFEVGAAVSTDDLAQIPAVLTALARAIETRRNVWCPFPTDLLRESHIRGISLVLQLHGLQLLLGRDLAPSRGFNALDHAVRTEVLAVFNLDHAVLASAGMETLGSEIEEALAAVAPAADLSHPSKSELPSNSSGLGEKFYSTAQAAGFFGKSNQWIYWGLRNKIFCRPDGTAIEPLRLGKSGKHRFTVPVLREIAHSCYRRGILSEDKLKDILGELAEAEAR